MASWTYKPGSDPNNASGAGFNPGAIDQGYYVTYPVEDGTSASLTNPTGTPMDPANHSPSGYLENSKGETVHLWITQAQISFSAAGSFAQSARMKEFFPRNFVDPVWSIQGIVPNSFQYQRLAEFIRRTHFDALNPTSLSDVGTKLPTLHINAGNLGNLASITTAEKSHLNKTQRDFLNSHPNAVQGKGPHHAQHVKGYIANFSRGAQQFINVPTYQFDFSVVISYGDLFQISNWAQIYREATKITAITYADLGTGQAGRVAPPPSVISGGKK